MAYMNFSEPGTAAHSSSRSLVHAVSEAQGFVRQEWNVIVLAKGDGLASLREPGPVARFFAWIFGGSANRSLSDPRLETLRRLAVFAWHYGYVVPMSAVKAFKAAGFSDSQYELLMQTISGERTIGQRRSRVWMRNR